MKFNQQEAQEIEQKVKDWLPLDGSISVETTKSLIEYLTPKDPSFSCYAYWQLTSYVKAFDVSQASLLFCVWFCNKFGRDVGIVIGNMSESIERYWSQLQYQPNSVLEAIVNYRLQHKLEVPKLLTELAAKEPLSPSTIEALGDVPAPKTQGGIGVMATKFGLNESKLIEILL